MLIKLEDKTESPFTNQKETYLTDLLFNLNSFADFLFIVIYFNNHSTFRFTIVEK